MNKSRIISLKLTSIITMMTQSRRPNGNQKARTKRNERSKSFLPKARMKTIIKQAVIRVTQTNKIKLIIIIKIMMGLRRSNSIRGNKHRTNKMMTIMIMMILI